ncbi:glycosyltransferase family 39 protein [Rothia koreensis]|uniref:glycosyltransferase family 39 protein n=1 Tax=Rothia koreensis TaxID=592378 RepID=UPI003FCDA4F6
MTPSTITRHAMTRTAPTAEAPNADPVPRRRPILFRREPGEPAWINPAIAAMMVAATTVYLWNLTISGYGNSFYAATVRAGSTSWTSMLFGSLDANNGITVDKPPAAYWIPSLFARVFGFSSFTVLLPQALMGIATVWVLYLAVRRTNGKIVGLVAGSTLTLTPVAVMMFRFNNPDAMLTLCLVLGAYFTIRAIQSDRAARFASAGWMLGAGLILGLAFLVKMLQGFMTIPALVVAFAIAAQAGWLRKIRDVVVAGIGVCLPVGAYAAVFAWWPEGSRPYMAGTESNSFWELVMGYNGLARIFGNSGGGGAPGGASDQAAETAGGGAAAGAAAGGAPGGGGPGGGTMFGGDVGVFRMFNSGFGAEISWLIPAAVIILVAGFWLTRRARRTDDTRAALIVWGGWLIVNAGVFSFMEGTIHPYYVVVLSPAVAAIVGIGVAEFWRGRRHSVTRRTAALALLATVIWSFALMQREAPDWLPWLRWVLLIGGSVTSVLIFVGLPRSGTGSVRRGAAVLAVAALVFGGLGSGAWALATVGNAHNGSIPTSGPSAAGEKGGMGQGAGGPQNGAGGQGQGDGQDGQDGQNQVDQQAGQGQGAQQDGQGQSSQPGGGANGGGMGGEEANSELTDLLKNAGTEYSAATVGATSAASYMLSSDTEVLDIGGWMGSDPYPTVDEFKSMVDDGRIRYFVAGGMGGGGMGESSSSEIQEWVKAHYEASTVGGTTVYDLTKEK